MWTTNPLPAALAVLALSSMIAAVGCGDDGGAVDGGIGGDSAARPDTGAADSAAADSAAADTGVADAATPSDGATADTSAADSGTATGPTPTLPAPDGPCPTFESGTETILGLATDILAGTPGATPGPILFTWHGTGGSGTRALNAQLPRSIRDDIVAQGGLVIAPNDDGLARTGHSPNGVWYEGSDLEYADHIVACAVRDHNIDPRRIYVTGCSAGGLMASAMAVQRSSYVAAAAPNSGGLTRGQTTTLEDPAHVPAMMTLHGGEGDTVIVNFGETSARLQDVITAAGGFGVDCNHSSGHCGAPATLHERGWEFMQAHPFGTSPSPYAGALPGLFPDYCTIR